MDYREHATQNARLIILRELASETDYRLNETILGKVLDSFGHAFARSWLREQLQIMETLGAIVLTKAGSTLVAEITRAGIEHVERRTTIDGIARPSPEH